MPTLVPPVRRVTLDEIRAARARIAGTITRTPLVRLLHDRALPEIAGNAGQGVAFAAWAQLTITVYNDVMITRGIRDFVNRDWDAARRAKDRYWAERIGVLGAAEGFRVAEELRIQAQVLNRSWPHAVERRADLEAHIRLAGVLRRAGSASRR